MKAPWYVWAILVFDLLALFVVWPAIVADIKAVIRAAKGVD